MTDEEFVKNFTELRMKCDANTKEIDSIKEKQDEYGELLSTMKVFKNEQDHMKTDITEIKNTVNAIAEKPAKRWDSLIGIIISALAGAFMGWALSGFAGV